MSEKRAVDIGNVAAVEPVGYNNVRTVAVENVYRGIRFALRIVFIYDRAVVRVAALTEVSVYKEHSDVYPRENEEYHREKHTAHLCGAFSAFRGVERRCKRCYALRNVNEKHCVHRKRNEHNTVLFLQHSHNRVCGKRNEKHRNGVDNSPAYRILKTVVR